MKLYRVYPVLSGEYRAYVVNHAEIQAWGCTEKKALINLQSVLVKSNLESDKKNLISLSIGEKLEYL